MKFRKTTELKLGNNNFTIYHWSPSQVIKNMPLIGRFIAVPMGTVAGSILQGGESFQDALPTAMLYIFERMDSGGMEIIDLLLEGVEVNGFAGKVNIDEVFEDNVMDLLELLKTVLEINYGCFFGKSGFGNLQGLLEKLGMVREVQNLGQEETQGND